MDNEIEADVHAIERLLGWDSDDDITTAAQVRGEKGLRRDIQGIIWEGRDYDRQEFRKARLNQYKEDSDSEVEEESSESEEEEEEESSESDEFLSLSQLQAESSQRKEQWKSSDKGIYYDFWRYARLRSTHNDVNYFSDFIWATSKHDVYTASDAHVTRIKHLSALTLKLTDILDLEGSVVPSESHPGNIVEGFTATELQTISVGYNLLIVTGTDGELILKRLDKAEVSCCFQMPTEEEEKRKINAVDIYMHHSGGIKFMTANEEGSIKHFNGEPFHL